MPFALLGLAIFGIFTSTVFAAMVLWAIPAYLRERRAAQAELTARPGFTPPLTLLKPLHGAEPDLEPHLESFFTRITRSTKFSSARAMPATPGLRLRGAWQRAIRASPYNFFPPAASPRTSTPKSPPWN